MLRINPVIAIIFLLLSCSSHQVVKEIWPNGSPKLEEYAGKNGYRTVYSYYPNGQLEYKAVYFHQMLDGESVYYGETGQVKSISNYSAGKLNGKWLQYNSNGSLIHITNYLLGRKEGVEEYYWDNGNLKSRQTFEFGEPIVNIQRWDESGKMLN